MVITVRSSVDRVRIYRKPGLLDLCLIVKRVNYRSSVIDWLVTGSTATICALAQL